MKTIHLITTAAAGAILFAVSSLPAAAQSATAPLKNAEGKEVGSANLAQTPHGVLINLSVKGLPPGEHAFHVHAVVVDVPPGDGREGVDPEVPRTEAPAVGGDRVVLHHVQILIPHLG